MARLPNVVLKAVILIILRGAKEKAMLEEFLCRMGCHGQMEQPWCFKYKKTVSKLLVDQDNWWMGTMLQDSNKSIATAWCKVYNFPIWDEGMATRMEKFVDGKLSNPISPKDGYTLLDCKNVRARQMLDFLVPILYSKTPTRVTIMNSNTIFGALFGKREVDWVLVI